MASTTDALGTTTWSYDLAGRPLKKTLPDDRFIGWAYDADGRITERSSPAGTVRYTFDANGRLASVTDPAGRITGYTWNAAGELSRVHYPNGTETRSEYDAAGRISQKAHLRTSSGELIAATRYTYTGGQRSTVEVFDGASSAIEVDGQLQLANPVRSTDYGYDELQRLVSETLSVRASTEVREIAYVYDAVGNRTRRTVTIGASTLATDYTFDANDRLSTETSTDALGNATTSSYAWDQNGNLESKSTPSGVTLYGWDSENRLIEVRRGADEASASTVATYAYDADGLRIRRTEPGSPPRVTDYLTDPSFPFAQVLEETETLGTATETTHYVWGAELIEQLRGGQGTFYHADALGSVKALTDEAGATSDLYEYEAFGELASHAGASDNAYRYTGEYFDELIGLQYNRARWYSAEVGRWTAMDPHPGVVARPGTLNDYAYVGNGSVSSGDPSGMMSLAQVGAAAAGMGVLVSAANYVINPYSTAYDDGTRRPTRVDGVVVATGAGLFAAMRAVTDSATKPREKRRRRKPTDGHHPIPKYLCGHPNQDPLVELRRLDHTEIHRALRDYQLNLSEYVRNRSMMLPTHVGLTWRRGDNEIIRQLAESELGRGEIARGIAAVYSDGVSSIDGTAWWDLGIPTVLLGSRFENERAKFVGGSKVNPVCVR